MSTNVISLIWINKSLIGIAFKFTLGEISLNFFNTPIIEINYEKIINIRNPLKPIKG